MTINLTPPMQKGKEPPFYEMDALMFQDLGRDLVELQEPVTNCRIYGDNGQAQHGIDIRCDRRSGVLEVAQVKCYQHFTPRDIRDASEEFLKHLAFWQVEGVRKFILIVACRVSSTQANDQIIQETKKFKALGINYELWDAIRIRDLLRKHNELISTYFDYPEFWQNVIGSNPDQSRFSNQPNYAVGRINDAIVTAFNDLSSSINTKVSKELEENRNFWKEGSGGITFRWIKTIKDSGSEWDVLSSEVRAGILRLEALLVLNQFLDYEQAGRLLDEAKLLDPAGADSRFRAILHSYQFGHQVALNTLGALDDVDSLCVRASLLIHAERVNEAIQVLEGIVHTGKAEVHRLLSLAHLNLKNLGRASDEIKTALFMEPNWESIQIVNGMVAYFSALSPAIFDQTGFVWPLPIEAAFFKTTDEAVSSLEKAANIFEKLLRNPLRSERDLLSLQVWHAACLAGDFRKQERAKQVFEKLLDKNPTDQRLIAWALVRGYTDNLDKNRQELKRLRKQKLATPEHIVSSIMLEMHFKHFRSVFYILQSSKKKLLEDSGAFLWEYWNIHSLIASKKLKEARVQLNNTQFSTPLDPLKLLLIQKECQASGNPKPYVDFLLSGYRNNRYSIYLWELCNYYADEGQWQEIAPFSEALVNEMQTLESLRLSSTALYNQKKYGCVSFE